MCIFRKTRRCIDEFTTLQGLRSESKSASSQSLDINGEFGRFEIWAENIGALQAPNQPTSLDHRLRDSTGVTRQVEAILDDIVESIQELADAFSGIKEKTDNGNSGQSHLESPESASEDDDDTEELLACVSEGISTLFKVSVIIRKATHRDRYARAAASDQPPIDHHYDIAHVCEKFPKVGTQESSWLAERLGKANTRRRQFLRYFRNHRERLAAPSVHDSEKESADNPRKRRHNSSGSHEAFNIIDSESRFAPTSASTLKALHAIDAAAEIEYIAADNLSQTSFTPTVTERSEEYLTVMPLEDVSGGNPEFECPYCYQIQREMTERRWRKHVFADLQAYICVSKDCSDVSFPDSSRWIEHEFDAHQRAWKCNRCSKTFTTRAQFVDHMASRHSRSLSENQLLELAEICWFQRPQVPANNCPFCDDWDARLREINQHILRGCPVLVSKKQYRRHVGAHMEQLALFAIGPSQANGSEAGSQSNNAVGEADHIHATDAAIGSTTASFAVRTQQGSTSSIHDLINEIDSLSDAIDPSATQFNDAQEETRMDSTTLTNDHSTVNPMQNSMDDNSSIPLCSPQVTNLVYDNPPDYYTPQLADQQGVDFNTFNSSTFNNISFNSDFHVPRFDTPEGAPEWGFPFFGEEQEAILLRNYTPLSTWERIDDPSRPALRIRTEESSLRFACPYHQRDQSSEPKQRSCLYPGFRTIARLKEHLYRYHMQPPYCVRCCQKFTSQEELDSHLAIKTCPDVPVKPIVDGMTNDQRSKLKKRQRKSDQCADEEKWARIYRILFPTDEEVPSPWVAETEENVNDSAVGENWSIDGNP